VRGCTWLLECVWFGELDLFSYRDQPGLPIVLDKLKLWDNVEVLDDGVRERVHKSGSQELKEEVEN
jgi:hypothetical protein